MNVDHFGGLLGKYKNMSKFINLCNSVEKMLREANEGEAQPVTQDPNATQPAAGANQIGSDQQPTNVSDDSAVQVVSNDELKKLLTNMVDFYKDGERQLSNNDISKLKDLPTDLSVQENANKVVNTLLDVFGSENEFPEETDTES